MHSSAVIIIMKPDVFIICHSLRQAPHPQRVAPYRPLAAASIAVGTLTSKRLNSFSFIISPHTDGANVFTLVCNIKVILHQKEFLFEGSDTNLLQRSIEFSSLEQDVFEQLKNCWTKKEEEEEEEDAKKIFSSLSVKLNSCFQSAACWFCSPLVNRNQ